MRGKLHIWTTAAMAAMALAGCGEETATAPEETATFGEAGGNEAQAPILTIERDGTTVTVEPAGEASLLNIEPSQAAGDATIRSGTCESQGDVVVHLGEVGISLVTEVEIAFEELTGGGYILTIGDSSCVELQRA